MFVINNEQTLFQTSSHSIWNRGGANGCSTTLQSPCEQHSAVKALEDVVSPTLARQEEAVPVQTRRHTQRAFSFARCSSDHVYASLLIEKERERE